MLHQVLPHVHHEHVVVNETKVAEHHHSHAQDHEKEKEKNKDSNDHAGLLDFLLESHAHTYHSSNFEVRNIGKRQFKDQEFSAYTLTELQISFFKKERKSKKIIAYPPPDSYNIYLLTPALRGPPVLG